MKKPKDLQRKIMYKKTSKNTAVESQFIKPPCMKPIK